MKYGKWKSRKNKKRALHVNQQETYGTYKPDEIGLDTPPGLAAAIASGIALLMRRQQVRNI